YPADDLRFRLVDLPLPGHWLAVCPDGAQHVVAKGIAAAGLTRLDPAAQTTARFIGKVLEIERAHGALEPNVEFAHFSLGQRYDLHASKAHALVEASDVFLVAASTLKRL